MDKIKQSHFIFFFWLTLMVLIQVPLTQAQASIVNVPNTLTAPVMLYDEGGNVLADGSYEITITLKDITGFSVYEEEQEVTVVSGVSAILIGQGYVPGTNHGSAAGGLSVDAFDVIGDISVEILVDGQSSPQQIATLSSQPYSFISEYAIGVASDAITTESIQDGTIIASDLDPSFLEELQTTTATGTSGSSVSDTDIALSDDTSLNNSGATTVSGALEDLDGAIDTLREVDLNQSLETLSTEIAATYVKKDGTSSMTGDLNMGTQAITNVGNVDGVDVSALSTSTSELATSVSTLESSLGSIASQTYEDGTYTPTISFSGGSGNVTPTYTTTSGRYTRIGRQVFVDIFFYYQSSELGTAGAGTGQIGVSLPFTASSSHKPEYFPCGHYNNSGGSSTILGFVLGNINASTNAIYLYKQTSFSVISFITGDDQNTGLRIIRLKFNYEI